MDAHSINFDSMEAGPGAVAKTHIVGPSVYLALSGYFKNMHLACVINTATPQGDP